MSVMLVFEWEGVTPSQYDSIMKTMDFEKNRPVGLVSHAAGFAGKKLHVADVWENEAAFKTFTDTRLMPAVQKEGITAQPKFETVQVHRLYANATAKAA